jgi:hypothetical protein
MLDLRFAEFHELFIELWYYFGLLYEKMIVQGSRAQGLDSLSDDLFVWYFRSLGLQLKEPPVEIRQHLEAGHKIFFHIELHLETLEVEQL